MDSYLWETFGHWTLGPDIIVCKSCMEILPCKHDVINNNRKEVWSAIDICRYCNEHNMITPEHFRPSSPDYSLGYPQTDKLNN